jgi:hypothetical protein
MDLLTLPSHPGAGSLRALALCATLICACVPNLDTDEARVGPPRVLAVRAEPAEAKPGSAVRYTALVADAAGSRRDGFLGWFYCLAQKPLAELGPVARTCLSPNSEKLSDIGEGISVRASLPSDGCSLFGPNVPQPPPGEEPSRPVDPDATGGYKQPIIFAVDVGQGEIVSLFEQRISCDLPGVSSDTLIDYRLRYHANENPRVLQLHVTRASGKGLSLRSGELLELNSGERIELSAQWPRCPESDECGDGVCGPDETRVSCAEDCASGGTCDGAERYLWYDVQRRELTVRRESMRVSWYASAGTFEQERTGRDEADTSVHSVNTWTAPGRAGEAALWVVLRDARGGVGTFEIPIDVR